MSFLSFSLFFLRLEEEEENNHDLSLLIILYLSFSQPITNKGANTSVPIIEQIETQFT